MAGLEGLPGVIRNTPSVRAAGDAESNSWWPTATLVLGTAHSMLGHDDQARDLFEASLASIGAAPAFEASALAHLALLDLRPATSQAPNVKPAAVWASPNGIT